MLQATNAHGLVLLLFSHFFLIKADHTDCGQVCRSGTVKAGAQQYCGVDRNKKALTAELCCPFGAIPNPDTCHWTGTCKEIRTPKQRTNDAQARSI
jgi:hypothetical protein